MRPDPVLRLWFVSRAVTFRTRRPRPSGVPRVEVPGPEPLTVLIVGAGLAAGYGVTTQDGSLAGSLARCIARGTGRGVVVEVAAAGVLPGRAVLGHLRASATRSHDVVVFCPCYLEAPIVPTAGMRRFGAAIQHHLLTTGREGGQVVMLGLPRPSRFSRRDLAAAEAATDANAVMRHLAELDARVLYIEPPTFESVHTEEPFDEDYYARAGEGIADALLARLAG